jgi:aspartate/methionine/tyrosine aminotransferase
MKDFTEFISKRSDRVSSSGIRKIFNLMAQLKDPINLSIGQPDFAPHPSIQEATIQAVKNGKFGYTHTQGLPELREKIAEKYRQENTIEITKDQVLVTPGASSAIFLALSALIDEGDEVIIPDPYFVEYPELVKFLGGVPVLLDTYPDFSINPKKLESLITEKTKLIIINTPNNPTGAVYSKETLERIAEIAKQKDILILADEIYEYFVYDDVKHFSIGSIYEGVITISGLSKTSGIPGWRLCWAVGPNALIQKMAELSQYMTVCAPSIIQYGALASFATEVKEYTKQKIREYEERRNILCDALKRKYEVTIPKGAFYIMPDVKDGDSFVQKAVGKECLFVPGSIFSDKKSHVRMSFAVSIEKIEEAIKRLEL